MARFEAPSFTIFGHLVCLFIGIPEPSTALGRLAHWLRRLYLPQMALDRASPDHNRHLQVAAISAKNPTTFLQFPATSWLGRPSAFAKIAPPTISHASLRFDWPEKLPVGFAFAKLSKIALWPPKFGLSHFGPFH